METLNKKKQIEELEEARKKTNNKKEDRRLKAIILKLKGFTLQEISDKLDISTRSVSNWYKKYKDSSIAGFKRLCKILCIETS